MSKNFLQLVNDAIIESKVTLDPLTVANFDSPPRTHLYNRFKDWVNRSYKELMIKRNEWHMRNERAILEIWPRLHLTALTYVPSIGDVLVGSESGVQFTVKGVYSYEDAVLGDAVTEHTLAVQFADGAIIGDLILNETFDRVSPSAATNVGQLKGLGFYDFKAEIPQLQRVDHHNITIFEHPSNITTATRGNMASVRPLFFVPWEKWVSEYAMYSWAGNMPEFITQTPQGSFDFYPKPDKNYLVSINYARTPLPLVAATDIPEALPEEYEDYILWRTVVEFADYDSNTRLFARANKHVEEYLYWLERDQMPEIKMGRNRFYDKYQY